MLNYKIRKVCEDLLNIHPYKLKYILQNGLITGTFQTLSHYGIELNEQTFDIFYDVVSTVLSGSEDIEYEFTKAEYDGLMNLKKYMVNKDGNKVL